MRGRGAARFARELHDGRPHSEGHNETKTIRECTETWKVTTSASPHSTDLMGAAAMVEAAEDAPLVVPNFSCRRRTSRGGLATEFTNAILTCRPAKKNKSFELIDVVILELSCFMFNFQW